MANRVCLGTLPNGTYGLQVSKPGVDVLATDAGGLMFDSGADFMRVVARGTVSLFFMQSSVTINVGQNFDYVPMIQTLHDLQDGTYRQGNINVSVSFSGSNVTFTSNFPVGNGLPIPYIIYSTRAQ